MNSIYSYLPIALKEGEGVGTAYEYFAKSKVFDFCVNSDVKKVLIAGLPQKYGFSLDFVLRAVRLDWELTVYDEREKKLSEFVKLAKSEFPFFKVNIISNLEKIDEDFELILSCEVLQRFDERETQNYLDFCKKHAKNNIFFVPNSGNGSHAKLSGLKGLNSKDLKQYLPDFKNIGFVDMPPFPPGITLSNENRENMKNGFFKKIAIYILQLYCNTAERMTPNFIKSKLAHIIYIQR